MALCDVMQTSLIDDLRVCAKCHIAKPVSEFPARERDTPSKRRSNCKACRAAYMREYWERRGGQTRTGKNAELRRRYGLSIEQYEAMVQRQGGVCAICLQPPKPQPMNSRQGRRQYAVLCVDHDHATNQIRALLCNTCNRVLGMLGDNPALLRAAAEYLEAHRLRGVQ